MSIGRGHLAQDRRALGAQAVVLESSSVSSHVGTAEVNWGQRTRSGTSYAPAGVFFFAVESLVPGHVGKVQTGSFVVIK